MRRSFACAAQALIFVGLLDGEYSNLIATSDGNTVYVQAQTGIETKPWFAVRFAGSKAAVEAVSSPVSDVNSLGTVIASSTYGDRYCGFGGSSCFLAPACRATFAIRGPGIDISNIQRRTFIRLDRSGNLAWIDQENACPGLGQPRPAPSLNGLYESATLRPIAPANGAKIASVHSGRRLITDRGRALVFLGPQLHWLDAAGARQIRHTGGAFEAVTDAAGENIVYVDAPVGRLHWIAGLDDEDLGLMGSAPALSDDGRTLVFLGSDQTVRAYDRATRAVRRLGSETYLDFALGGPAIFAITTQQRLVRIDAASGSEVVWLPALPQLTSDAPRVTSFTCPLPCYGLPEPELTFGPGMLFVLRGHFPNQTRWRARSSGMDIPITPISEEAAWLQVPSNLSTSDTLARTVELYHPDHPIALSIKARVSQVVECFGILHQDFGGEVSSGFPAAPGEIVHVFLTGLSGVEFIPDGAPNPLDRLILVANPPALADPDATNVLFFGLAPGLIGIQQLDMRVLRASTSLNLFADYGFTTCLFPSVSQSSSDR